MFKVDIFITKHSRFEHMQFQRRELQVVTEDPLRKAYVATAEDIILAKLQWYRLGGEISDRQWGDVLGVLKVQSGRLDLEYLRSWAFELDVLDLFQKAFRETE